jgi:uncharacterized damage-inducible protein DinB
VEDDELRARLHHLHMVQWAYLHIWRSEPARPRELGTFPTLAAVRGWAREGYRELAAYLASVPGGDVGREVRFPWAERIVQRYGRVQPTRWDESVLQVAMHGAHHRGQVARRLRELDVEPPLLDFIAWIWLDRPEADWGSEEAA